MAEWEDIPTDEWEGVPTDADTQVQRTPETPIESAMGAAYNQLQNVGEGAMLGFRDEAEAALSGAWDNRPYDERLRDIEERRRILNINNPYKTAATLSGGLLTGALTGQLFSPSSVVGAASTGLLEGGLTGAGMSEGTLSSDPAQLFTDTAAGGVIGAGAVLGLGGLANVSYRAMKPASQRILGWIKGDAENVRLTTHERNLRTAKEMGIPTTAPERMASDTLMKKQARYESDEILSDTVQPVYDARQARVNQIAREEIGLPQADDINRFDLGEASKNISNKFKSIEGDYQAASLDDDIFKQLDDLVSTRSIVKPPQKAKDAVERTMEMLDEGMSGRQYLQQRSLLDKEIQAIYKSEKPDVRLAETYADIIDILDDKFASQLSGESADLLAEARKQWKNLRLLDRPNAVQGGDVKLSGIKTGLNKNKGFLRGMDESPLAKLADFNDSTKFNFGRSGTAERSPFNILQRVQSTIEKPFASANISRGGMIPGMVGSPEASAFGGAVGATATPPLLIGTKDELKL